jgi:predicted RNA binding protein YcfA (HicA-like mRNA interferase family)
VTSRALRRILKELACVEVRQSGSHLRVECGTCRTTVPIHKGEDLKTGLLRKIERDLEPCLGRRWLKRQGGA